MPAPKQPSQQLQPFLSPLTVIAFAIGTSLGWGSLVVTSNTYLKQDVILRKPGRFTPEEYDIMKTHAAEGARILTEILRNNNDELFRRIAVNMAHYHHERVDGSGYPDKLKGDEIPLEARIMAIADVYDALVSKRVYKDKMSFEEADKIIMDGMGTQFDDRLKMYYEQARPKLEAYYSAESA